MGYKFPIGLYSIRYGGRMTDYHTVFKVPEYSEISDKDFVDTIIKKATGIKDWLDKQLYSIILPGGTAP
eukprot:6108416-Ditylum_brightwellii.AAC.2